MASPGQPSFTDTLFIRDHCLCLHAQRAARVLARRFDEAFRPFGITSGQFSLLNALNRPKAAAMADVARLLAMDRTTLTAALKPLERAGLVTVGPDKHDRRKRLLALTPAGRMVLEAAMPVWRSEHAAIETWLDDGDRLRAGLAVLGGSGLALADKTEEASA